MRARSGPQKKDRYVCCHRQHLKKFPIHLPALWSLHWSGLELHEGLEGQWSLLPLTWPRCPFKSCPLTFNNFQGKCPSQNVSGLVLALLKMKFQSYSTCPLKISFRILNLPQGGALYFWKIFLEQRISPEQMFMTLLTISKLSGPNFLKPASTKKLLSTEKHCLTKNRLPAKLTLGLNLMLLVPHSIFAKQNNLSSNIFC